MKKKQLAGVKLTGIVDRTQFGMGSGLGGPTLSDNVEITTNAEFVEEWTGGSADHRTPERENAPASVFPART